HHRARSGLERWPGLARLMPASNGCPQNRAGDGNAAGNRSQQAPRINRLVIAFALDVPCRPAGGKERAGEIRAAYLKAGPGNPFHSLWRVGATLMLALALGACSTTETFKNVQPQSFVPTYSSPKYAAIVVDANDGKVLYQTSSDASRYPA